MNLQPYFKIACVKSVFWPASIGNVVNVSLSGGSLGYWTACNNFKRYCTLPYCVLYSALLSSLLSSVPLCSLLCSSLLSSALLLSALLLSATLRSSLLCLSHPAISLSIHLSLSSPFSLSILQEIMVKCSLCQHIEAATGWLPFSRRHFEMDFLEWKFINFN